MASVNKLMERVIQPQKNRIQFAEYLIIALPPIIAISPTLTALVEFAIYVIFITTPELRQRFIRSIKQPMIYMGLGFCFVLILSSIWSEANWHEKAEHIRSWRKILLLPITAALLCSFKQKQRFLLVIVVTTTIYATIL